MDETGVADQDSGPDLFDGHTPFGSRARNSPTKCRRSQNQALPNAPERVVTRRVPGVV